jgi:hypothetical protein
LRKDITFSEGLAQATAFIQAHASLAWQRQQGWGAAFQPTRDNPAPPSGLETRAPGTAAHQFNELALRLFELQSSHNPVLRRLCESRGLIRGTLTDWRQIPAVPAAVFKELEVTSLSPAERTRVFFSSGTGGQRPSRHFHDAESLRLYEDSLLPWFKEHLLGDLAGRGRELDLVCLTPSSAQAPNSSLVHMLETVRNGFSWGEILLGGSVDATGAWTIEADRVVSRLQAAARSNRPVAILGTAFGFVHLLDHLAGQGLEFRLPGGSRVMETGGYKGRSRTMPKAGLHALIARRLGLPASHIVCEYGMSELSSQAYDGRVTQAEPRSRETPTAGLAPTSGRAFHFPPWARVQLISPETGQEVVEGETGLIRVCDLANVRSALAIQTEDLGIRRGNGFELLGRGAAVPRGCSLMAA